MIISGLGEDMNGRYEEAEGIHKTQYGPEFNRSILISILSICVHSACTRQAYAYTFSFNICVWTAVDRSFAKWWIR